VARAIAASKLPVVSAVGHETDFTIADFVADLRAPTPSAAAELITEAQHRIAEHLASLNSRLDRASRFQLLQARQRLTRVPAARAESRIMTTLHRLEQRLDDTNLRMEANVNWQIRERQRHVAELSASVLRHDPRQQLAHARQHFTAGATRMEHALRRTLHEQHTRLNSLHARLQSLSPLAVLERGYALVLDGNGALVRSMKQVHAGDQFTTRLSDGAFTSRVENAASTQETRKS
jgi:exodeoxyribonuclease VII large subunit